MKLVFIGIGTVLAAALIDVAGFLLLMEHFDGDFDFGIAG